jgi:hypothetical protein
VLTVVGAAAVTAGIPVAALGDLDEAAHRPNSPCKLYTGIGLASAGAALGVVTVQAYNPGGLIVPTLPITLSGAAVTSVGAALWGGGRFAIRAADAGVRVEHAAVRF